MSEVCPTCTGYVEIEKLANGGACPRLLDIKRCVDLYGIDVVVHGFPCVRDGTCEGITVLIVVLCNFYIDVPKETIRYLIEHGADPNYDCDDLNGGRLSAVSAVIDRFKGGYYINSLDHLFDIFELFVEHGAAPNVMLLAACRSEGMYFFDLGDMQFASPWLDRIVQVALKMGADAGVCDLGGVPVLMHATSNGLSNIVLQLLEHNPDVHFINERGQGVLHFAYRCGGDVTRALIAAGADVNVCDKNRCNVVQTAFADPMMDPEYYYSIDFLEFLQVISEHDSFDWDNVDRYGNDTREQCLQRLERIDRAITIGRYDHGTRSRALELSAAIKQRLSL